MIIPFKQRTLPMNQTRKDQEAANRILGASRAIEALSRDLLSGTHAHEYEHVLRHMVRSLSSLGDALDGIVTIVVARAAEQQHPSESLASEMLEP
jgi:hypothetical protein